MLDLLMWTGEGKDGLLLPVTFQETRLGRRTYLILNSFKADDYFLTKKKIGASTGEPESKIKVS